MPDVTVIGLGNMGSRLAATFLDKDLAVGVWNRSERRYPPLTDWGADAMESPLEAIRSSPVTLICVDTNASVRSLLAGAAGGGAFAGHTIVNMTTGTAAQAAELQAVVEGVGAGRYLDGHIGVAPAAIGARSTRLLYGGPAELWTAHKALLLLLGGASKHLGDDVGAACVVAAALSTYFHTAVVGFVEALAYAHAVGLPLDEFAALADDRALLIKDTVRDAINAVATGDFVKDASRISVHLDTVEMYNETIRDVGTSIELSSWVAEYLRRGVEAGMGDLHIAAAMRLMLPDAVQLSDSTT